MYNVIYLGIFRLTNIRIATVFFTLLSFTNIINLRGLLDPTWNFWISTPFRNKKRLIIKIEKVKEDNRKFFILFFQTVA